MGEGVCGGCGVCDCSEWLSLFVCDVAPWMYVLFHVCACMDARGRLSLVPSEALDLLHEPPVCPAPQPRTALTALGSIAPRRRCPRCTGPRHAPLCPVPPRGETQALAARGFAPRCANVRVGVPLTTNPQTYLCTLPWVLPCVSQVLEWNIHPAGPLPVPTSVLAVRRGVRPCLRSCIP
jgi:hypothetical protein